jgi:hypothetical protein
MGHVGGRRSGQVTREALTAVNIEEAACATSFNAFLAARPELAERTWTELVEAQEREGVSVGGKLLCSVLRPRFIGEGREAELARIGPIFARLIERAGEQVLRSEGLLDAIGANEQEREVWAIDPGYPGFTLTSRLDSFMIGKQPRFIEYNAESPAGIAFADVLGRIFEGLSAVRAWTPARTMRRAEARQDLLETLLWAYRTRGGRGTPFMAIIDWEHVITRRDFELCADYFRAHGIPTVIADPRRLQYRSGRLWLGEDEITLVYRRVLLDELLEKSEEAGDLWRAYREGAICMVNSPRSKLVHKKALFALLADGSLDLQAGEEEQRLIEECLPWTRLVRSERTSYQQRSVDLLPFILEHREHLALKPADDYGGKGVALGWESSPDEWERAVELAAGRPYVVQERVPMAQGEFPVWENGGLRVRPFLIDTNPLLFRGKMGGILTRISSSTLLNVSAGTGSAAPTFVVPEEGG